MLRIHSAPVTIYKIAYDDLNGVNFWSVGGNLTLEQWESLATIPDFDVYVTDGLVPSSVNFFYSIKVVEELGADLLLEHLTASSNLALVLRASRKCFFSAWI